MAAELTAGALINLLYDGVKQAMSKRGTFKSLLKYLKSTLGSLVERDIQQIGELNVQLRLPNGEIEDLKIRMKEGVNLVQKLSNVRMWNYCCLNDYSEQIVELDRDLKRLLQQLKMQESRDVLELLVLARQNEDKLNEMNRRLLDKVDEMNRRLLDVQRLLPERAGDVTESSVSGDNAETLREQSQGNGEQQVTSSDGGTSLQAVFVVLFDVVIEVKYKGTRDVKETLVSVKNIEAVIQKIEGSGLVQDQIQTKGQGALPEPLSPRVELDLVNVQGTRDVKETLVSARNTKAVVDKIEGSGVVQNQMAGSALGAAFETLFSAVLKAKSTAKMYQTHLGNLNTTLDSLKPLIIQLAQSSNHLVPLEKSLENFTTKMVEGKKLVEECCEVRRMNLIKQREYTDEIEALDDSLHRLLSILTEQLGSHSAMLLHRIDGNVVAHQIGVQCAVPPLPSVIVGLDAHLLDLKMTLLRDGTESILVLTAPVGCGKTTLATMFCHDQEVKGKFKENIFFVTVSYKVSYLIVQELCKHAGLEVPDLQNEENPFKWLQKFMTERGQNPLLLVLDDVQSESESLLDKFNEFKMPSCKVLVTSRYYFPKFGRTYPLDTLEDKDAMDLFRRSAFLPNTSSNIPDDIQNQIVELCKRFPLAITVVGSSLCNQPIEIWRKRLLELSKGSILESDQKLLVYLKSCLDDLDKGMTTVKDCFLDLGVFPQDQIIPVTALLDMWAESYEGAEDFMSIQNLYELTTRNLVSLVGTRNEDADGYYSEYFAIQHRMLRLLSIHESLQDPIGQRLIIDIRGDELPMWWKENKHKTKKARLVSISTDGLSSAKWHNMHLPKAEVLVLNFQTQNYVLPKFVKKMPKLKVLIVTNCGVLQANLSNFWLLESLPNLKRIRLERISIPSISKNSMQFKSMQKISLFMCSIGQAFSNSSIQILEAFPNLVELNIDYCNDLVELPAKLCDLIRLKKLSITNCHKLSALPEEIGKLVNLEVLRLRSSTELERLPGSIKNLKRLSFLDIYNCLSIKKLPEEIGEMSGLRKINMGQCSRLQGLPLSVLNLGELREVICDERTENLWGEPFKSSLINIKITVAKEQHNLNWLYYKP